MQTEHFSHRVGAAKFELITHENNLGQLLGVVKPAPMHLPTGYSSKPLLRNQTCLTQERLIKNTQEGSVDPSFQLHNIKAAPRQDLFNTIFKKVTLQVCAHNGQRSDRRSS
jgi:hypothetical protein